MVEIDLLEMIVIPQSLLDQRDDPDMRAHLLDMVNIHETNRHFFQSLISIGRGTVPVLEGEDLAIRTGEQRALFHILAQLRMALDLHEAGWPEPKQQTL